MSSSDTTRLTPSKWILILTLALSVSCSSNPSTFNSNLEEILPSQTEILPTNTSDIDNSITTPTINDGDNPLIPKSSDIHDSPKLNTDSHLKKFTQTTTMMNIAPGASGAFTDTAIDPNDPNFILIGTELNGVLRSTDGGKSFKNISQTLLTRRIFNIMIVPNGDTTYAYLATDDGVYRSDNKSGTLGDEWELKDNGFELGCAKTDGCATRNAHPIYALNHNSSNPNIIWAGISQTMQGNTIVTYRPTDAYKLYVSLDAGETWTGLLSLIQSSETIEDLDKTKLTVGLNIYSIYVNPDNNQQVTVATDKGLYYTSNASIGNIKNLTLIWYELGRSETFKSTDLGLSFDSCRSATVLCPRIFENTKDHCTIGSSTNACLPIEEHTGDTHPNLRKAEWSNGALYVLSNDLGWAGGIKTILDKQVSKEDLANCKEKDGLYYDCLKSCRVSTYSNDTNRVFYTGGIYKSLDKGLSWERLGAGSNGRDTPNQIRCSQEYALDASISMLTKATEKNTVLSFMEVNPDKEQIVISVPFIRGGKNGFYEYNNGNWVHIRDVCAKNDDTGLIDCYEGGRKNGLWGHINNDTSPGAYELTVTDWDDFTVYYGHIMGMHKITRDGSKYKVDHVMQNQSSEDSDYWTSTGGDLHCPFGGVVDFNDSLFISAIDVGVLKSKSYGKTWKLVTENNEFLLQTVGLSMDDSESIVASDADNVMYAHSQGGGGNCSSGSTSCNSILMSDKTGENWSVVGGTLFDGQCDKTSTDNTCKGNGYPVQFKTTVLKLDHSRTSKQRVFAGTHGAGLFVYDPNREPDEQWQSINELDDGSCNGLAETKGATNKIVADIWTSKSHPKLVFATLTDTDNKYGSTTKRTSSEGVYHIEINDSETFTCMKLQSSQVTASDCRTDGVNCNPITPHNVALSTNSEGQNRLVVTGKYSLWPVIYSANIDLKNPKNVNWQFSLDFKKRSNEIFTASADWQRYIADYPEWSDEYDDSNFWFRFFTSLAVDPNNPNIIIATLGDNPGSDHGMNRHVYQSIDAGKTWTIAESFEEMPTKSMMKAQFIDDYIYFSGRCTSMYRFKNPYTSK